MKIDSELYAIERLETLKNYQIMDSPEEKEFDDITNLASLIANTPSAFIGFLDDKREWFKSKKNLKFKEIPLEESICQLMYYKKEELEIKDTQKEELLKSNKFTRGENPIRYYFGVPIYLENRQKIGILAVLDFVPRELSRNQIDSLKLLSNNISNLLQNRLELIKLKGRDEYNLKALNKYFNKEDLFHDLFENTSDLIQNIELESGKFIYVNPSWFQKLEYTPKEISKLTFMDIIHEESRDHCSQLFKIILDGKDIPLMEAIFVSKSGKKIYVEGSSGCYFKDGKAYSTRGIFRDVTEKKLHEREIKEISEKLKIQYQSVPLASYIWKKVKDDFILSEVNNSARILSKFNLDDYLNKSINKFYSSNEKQITYIKDCFENQNSFRVEMVKDNKNLIAYFTYLPPDMVMVYKEDITNMIKSRESLIASYLKINNLERALNDHSIIAITDKKGKIIFANDKFAEISKFSVPEIIGKTHKIINSGYHPKEFFKKMWETIKSGKTWKGVVKNKASDGSHYWVDTTIVPFLDENNNPYEYLAIRVDITKLKEAEEKLVESESLQRAIVTSLDEIIFLFNSETHFLNVWTNDPSKLFLPKEKFIGKTVRESLGPEFGLLFENGVQSVLESNKIVTIEYYSPDGRDFYQAQLNLVVIQGEKMVSCLVRDITKRKLSEKALLESEEKFRVLTETANDAIITVNQKGIVLEWNNGAENLFGFSKSEVINESMHIFMPDDFIPLHEKGMERYLNTGVNNVIGKTVELTGKKKNGTLFPLELSTSSYFIGGEELFTGIIRDISQHKQFVEDLKKAKNQAELANIAKSEFISNMSHEIRTPMNSILGFSEILNQNLEDPALKYYSESIATSGKILLTLINDILDLSKIESGKLEIQNQKINIIEIINEMKLIFSNKFKEKNLEFKINIDKLFPSGILIDGVRTRQILLNLIGNAVKFTESGSVSIHLTDLKISKSKDLLDFVLIIEDTGIGISEDDQRHIFEAFSQAKKQNIEKYGGTGLGLAIVKKLVTLMGGVITIKSILGKGSSFYILFKNIRIVENSFTVREEARVDLKKKINFEPSKILMVDDNQLNRKLIVKYLSKFPELGVIEAENGLEAVQFASEIEFDLILMDMKMPVMDGYEAAKLIREKNIKIPIVAITASVFQETRSSILKVCDDFLPKPINESSVLKIISTYIKVIDSNQPQDRKEDEKKVKEYSIEELNKFKSLHKILKEEKLQKSKELIEYNAIFEIKEFGEDLLVLGEEYKFDELIKMSKDMLNYANLFDMEKLTLELKEFPNLIDTLENLINEE